MPIDFGLPTTTDAYAGVPTTHRNHQTALAQMLDPSYAGTLTATPTGAKRLNSSNGLAELFNGTAWVEWNAAWLKRAGGTMTGTLDMGGNQALLASTPAVNSAWFSTAPYGVGQGDNRTHFGYRTSGGAYENYIRGATTYFAGDARVGGDLFADSGLVVSGVGPGGFGIDTSVSSRVANTLVVGVNADEGVRAVGNGAFLSFFNAANTVRSGYVQALAGGAMHFVNESGGDIAFSTGGAGRWQLGTTGFYPQANNTYTLGAASLRPSTVFGVNGDFNGLISTYSGEPIRMVNSSSFVSGWNSAGSTRTGYLQFNAGSDVRLISETADLFLSTSTRAYIGIGGNVRFQQTAALADFKGCAVRTEPVGIAYAASLSVNASAGNYFEVGTLTGNVTSVSISNAAAGQWLRLRFKQDGTGGRTITTGNMGGTNAPAISGSPTTAAGKVSYLDLAYNVADARWEGAWLRLP